MLKVLIDFVTQTKSPTVNKYNINLLTFCFLAVAMRAVAIEYCVNQLFY